MRTFVFRWDASTASASDGYAILETLPGEPARIFFGATGYNSFSWDFDISASAGAMYFEVSDA